MWNNSCIFYRAEMFLCEYLPRVFRTITRDDDTRRNGIVMEIRRFMDGRVRFHVISIIRFNALTELSFLSIF